MKRISLMVSKTFWMKIVLAAWLLSFFLFLHACEAAPPTIPTPAATATKAVDIVNVTEPTDVPTSPPAPTSTPEPLPDLVIFFTPPGSDLQYSEEIKSLLEEVLTDSEIQLEITSTLTKDDLGDHVRLVAALGPINGMSELISSSPGTQFVAIGSSELLPQDNLSLVGMDSPRIDHQAFMAGVIGAIITPDWRIGIISTDEISSQAFINGGVYFCGLCRQVYPPFYDAQGVYIRFPLQYTVPSGAEAQDWQDAARFMIDRGVKMVYLTVGADNNDLLDTLEQAGVNVIGASQNGNQRPNWVATIHINPIKPLRQLLPNLLQGAGGGQTYMNLEIADINPDLFSPARQTLALSILEELEAGLIFTGFE